MCVAEEAQAIVSAVEVTLSDDSAAADEDGVDWETLTTRGRLRPSTSTTTPRRCSRADGLHKLCLGRYV